MTKGSNFIFFACRYMLVPAYFVEKLIFFSTALCWHSVKNHLTVNVRYYFLDSQFCSFINMSVFMSVPQCLDYCRFVLSLKSESMHPPTLFFSFNIVLGILGPLQFHMNFRISLSISALTVGILAWVVLNLQINFVKYF